MLRVNNLETGYGSRTVLKGVTFQLTKGKVLGIIGQNGSGKSTLLKTVCGLIPLLKGDIIFNNQEITSLIPHKLVKSGISFFTQGGLVIPSLTIEDHLSLAVLQNSNGNTGYQQAYDLFPQLYKLRKQRAGSLSGGERQILSFGILVAQETRIWLLDEPTSGLSPEIVSFTTNFLQKKNKEEGITMLLVEHNMDVAFTLSDHIVITRDGSLTKKFSREEFRDNEFLTKHVYN